MPPLSQEVSEVNLNNVLGYFRVVVNRLSAKEFEDHILSLLHILLCVCVFTAFKIIKTNLSL